MAEAVPSPTLDRLLKLVKVTLDETKDIWKSSEDRKRPTDSLQVTGRFDSPIIVPILTDCSIVGSDVTSPNSKFRQLLTLHLRINLLAQVYSTAGYTHGRPANVILQIIGGGLGPAAIEDLAEMYRVFLWEGIVLKGADPGKGLSIDGTHVSLGSATPIVDLATDSTTGDGKSLLGGATSPAKAGSSKAKEDNARAIRITVQNLAKVTTPLFQGIVMRINRIKIRQE